MRSRVPVLALGLLTLACATVRPEPRSGRDVAVTVASARDSLRGPWQLRAVGHPRSALVSLRAELSSAVDTVTRRDSLASETVLEWSSTPEGDGTRVLGMVRAFTVRAGGDSLWQVPPGLLFPVTFSATSARRDAQPQFVQPDAAACDARAAVVQAMRETWLLPPAQLDIGTRWQDSSVYPVCRDGIVLEVTSVRDYVVTGAELLDDRLALRVERRSRAALEGRGLQFGDSVTVRGTATGLATLMLSPDAAVVLRGEGTSTLTMELQGRRRTQQLVQTGALSLRVP